MVPRAPNNKPEFLNAIGIAKMPEPNELFKRCNNEPIVLHDKIELITKKKPNKYAYEKTETDVIAQS